MCLLWDLYAALWDTDPRHQVTKLLPWQGHIMLDNSEEVQAPTLCILGWQLLQQQQTTGNPEYKYFAIKYLYGCV